MATVKVLIIVLVAAAVGFDTYFGGSSIGFDNCFGGSTSVLIIRDSSGFYHCFDGKSQVLIIVLLE